MMKRIIWITIMLMIAAFFFYISRFWVFDLWSREGLFGIKELRPRGGLLAVWLRGTPLAPFELLIWVVAVFLSLTWVEKIYSKLSSSSH